MGFNVGSLSTYTDKATEILTSKVLFSDRMDFYTLEDDVQGSKYINTVSTTLYRQAGTCGLAESGSTTFGQVTLSVLPVSYKQKYCFEDLYTKGLKIERQAIAKGAEVMVEEALTTEFTNKVAQDVWMQLWAGATATGYLFDGWAVQALAASDRIVATSVSTITFNDMVSGTTGVEGVVQAMVNEGVGASCVWGAINEGQKLQLFVSPAVFNLYRQYLITANLYRIGTANLAVKVMDLPGYEGMIEMVEVPELATAVTAVPIMLLTWGKNLYVGSSIIDNITAPKAEYVIDQINDWVYYKSSLRLGAAIAQTGCIVTNK